MSAEKNTFRKPLSRNWPEPFKMNKKYQSNSVILMKNNMKYSSSPSPRQIVQSLPVTSVNAQASKHIIYNIT